MKVKDIMSKSIVTAEVDASVEVAARLMRDKNVGSLVVMKGSVPVGIVTERDLITKVLAENKKPSDVLLKDIMSVPLITIDAESSVSEAIELMREKGVRRLLVLEGGKLVGIVTVREPFVRSFYPERAHVNAPLLEEAEDMLLIAERLLENIGSTLSSGKSPDEYYKTSLRKAARPSERG
ncbi:MAG: Signal-transduction protein containing cAMP-binding [Candidatus Alkanophagales archaeon MCA70_species_1]|nr:Signal-transduction protein containing cAMP-binding [Candidatus Alkanophaga volatiphilum]